MKVRDEFAILRGLEDFRIAGALDPETPETMRARAAEHERRLRLERQLEQDAHFRQYDLDAAQRAKERRIAERAEAWKRGDPIPEPAPAQPYDPYRDIARAHIGFMSASSYPCGSMVVAQTEEGYPLTRAEALRYAGRQSTYRIP